MRLLPFVDPTLGYAVSEHQRRDGGVDAQQGGLEYEERPYEYDGHIGLVIDQFGLLGLPDEGGLQSDEEDPDCDLHGPQPLPLRERLGLDPCEEHALHLVLLS